MPSKKTSVAIANYGEIAKALCKEIRAGVYSDEGSFPSLTKIMQRFGVSRPSAVRSVAELKRLGLVATRKGAGTFVLQKNRVIGLAIPGTADSEFFSAIMDGLVFNCNKYGMDLVAGDIFAVDHDERAKQAERLARHFASVGVAGVIMQPVGFSENANQLNGIISDILDKAGIPVVLVDYDIATPPNRSKYDLVAIDNFGAGRKVAGFDDVRVAARMRPPLTSVRQPCFEIANIAFKTLLERMADSKLPPREILLDTTLVVRKSTTPPH